MAKTRGWLAVLLSKSGNRIFRFLTGCQERGVFPKAAGVLKLGILGTLAFLITSLSAQDREDVILCYKPMQNHPVVTEAEIVPNPTRGADTVEVRATTTIVNAYLADTWIDSAFCEIQADTVGMIPVDSLFGDTLEELHALLYVGNIEPGTTLVRIIVIDNIGLDAVWDEELVVTDEE